MQTTSKPITNNSQADESNHSPLFWRVVGGEAFFTPQKNLPPSFYTWYISEFGR